MTTLIRLVTRAELDGPGTPRRLDIAARLFAVTDDGRKWPLLDNRGWSVAGAAKVLRALGAEDIEEDARTVTGPDEPYAGRTQAEETAAHWSALARSLRRQGVEVNASALAEARHEVEIGPRLRARLG